MKSGIRMGVFVAMVALGSIFGAALNAFALDVPAIDVAVLETQLGSKAPPLVLDVREPSETAQGTIKGAKLIPLGQLETRLSELPKDKQIVVVCRSGNRSARATSLLLSNGFTNVENLSGGMNAWSSKCQNSSKKYC